MGKGWPHQISADREPCWLLLFTYFDVCIYYSVKIIASVLTYVDFWLQLQLSEYIYVCPLLSDFQIFLKKNQEWLFILVIPEFMISIWI